ncbi:hypothetical protein TNCV_4671911 [Trichonephila clavipes]|nr:hypothetical protein TNCV_4671911 [Trichonephila clavipes]
MSGTAMRFSEDCRLPNSSMISSYDTGQSSEVTDWDGSAKSGEALKTTRPELTHLRILWDLEQEEDHQQGG